MQRVNKTVALLIAILALASCKHSSGALVQLSDGIDQSAGGDAAYVITTPGATFYLEKQGGGLSSIVDADGVDWLGFHKEPGTGWKGEYRGFPNAVHRQDGNYFHAMNAGTDPSTSVVNKISDDHIQIIFTSENGQWQGQWDFYPNRCDFTMTKVSEGHKYWIQYEGVPGGTMDDTDFWYSSADNTKHAINDHFEGDLPYPEWMAFGDESSPRMLFLMHHEDDNHPDDYVSRPNMTVFAFGRRNKDKYLTTAQSFSIGIIESTDHAVIDESVRGILRSFL